ncbi:ulp1 protease family, C-terminal catalytic domain-containing protein, partial [Tanacetum coccineum]
SGCSKKIEKTKISKRKADEEATSKAAAQEEDAIRKSNEKTTKKKIKEAKREARKKLAKKKQPEKDTEENVSYNEEYDDQSDDTQDMFKWKKANGKYNEKKQFEAFSKTINIELEKDHEMKTMKDLEMKKLFSMHLETVKHPRAKDVLNKKPTIIRPKWGTKENDIDCGIFLMMHMEHYNGETAKNWNLEFPEEKEGNTVDIIKMRVRLATKILSREINIHQEKISTEA